MRHAWFFFGLTALSAMDWNRFLAALDKARIRLKEAAICMEISEAQLSRQIRGQEHMHVDRVAQLPAAFHQWYALLTLEAIGLPVEVERAARVKAALTGRKRMASMSGACKAKVA